MDSKTIMLLVVIIGLLSLMLFVCIISFCTIDKFEKELILAEKKLDDISYKLTNLESDYDRLLEENENLLQQIESLKNASEEEDEDDDGFEEGKIITFGYDLSDYTTNMLCWMDYRRITDDTSMQYKIQEECDTYSEYGIREYSGSIEKIHSIIDPHHLMFKGIHAAAMGSMFGRELGDIFKVTLMNGSEFYVFLAEFKDDGVTDPKYLGHPCKNFDDEDCTNVIEFIVDIEFDIPIEVVKTGTFTALEEFGGLHGNGGNIKTIRYIGHIDF